MGLEVLILLLIHCRISVFITRLIHRKLESMNSKDIGLFIAARRKDLGLTQSQLATKLNVSDGAVSKWERGVNFPDIAIVEALSEMLDISVTDLLKGEIQNSDPSVDEAVLETLKYSKESENRSVKRTRRSIRFWQGLLVLLVIITIGSRPALRWYQDKKSAVSYENILKFAHEDNWFGVLNGTDNFLGKYYGSSHYEEMKTLNILAQEKWARQNFGQLMTMSTLSPGEVDLLFVLLQKLGFQYFGAISYPKGDINIKQTLMISPLDDHSSGYLIVNYENRKISRIYYSAPLMNGDIPETDFDLYTEDEGILMTYSNVKSEIQKILDKMNNP